MVGRLVADPEVKYTPQGVAVASMRIAVNRVTRNEQGEYEADFFNVTAWRRTAEFAQNYLSKGRLISIDGRLQARNWTAQDGSRRTSIEIVADNIEGLDRRGDAEGGASAPRGGDHEDEFERAPASRQSAAPAAAGARKSAPTHDDLDDDPFADD